MTSDGAGLLNHLTSRKAPFLRFVVLLWLIWRVQFMEVGCQGVRKWKKD